MIIFTNGCFDVLHAGHMELLLYCRYLAATDPFYIALDSDKRIREIKGDKRPYYNEIERTRMLMRMTTNGVYEQGKLNKLVVDWVDIFDTDQQLYDIIKRIKPTYIIKGDEWKGKKVIGDDLAEVIFMPTFFKNRCSTSEIERRICEKNEIEIEKRSQTQSNWRPLHWRRNR